MVLEIEIDQEEGMVQAVTLEIGIDQETEKIVSERMKEVFEKQRAEQTRLARLRNADPNDIEA